MDQAPRRLGTALLPQRRGRPARDTHADRPPRDRRLIPIHAAHLPHGAIINRSEPLAALASSWLLIAQKLAESEPAPVDAGIRKAYQRSRRRPPMFASSVSSHRRQEENPPTPPSSPRPAREQRPTTATGSPGTNATRHTAPATALRRKIDTTNSSKHRPRAGHQPHGLAGRQRLNADTQIMPLSMLYHRAVRTSDPAGLPDRTGARPRLGVRRRRPRCAYVTFCPQR